MTMMKRRAVAFDTEDCWGSLENMADLIVIVENVTENFRKVTEKRA